MCPTIKTSVDKVSIFSATDRAKRRIEGIRESLNNFEGDPKKSERLEESKCKVCFYINNVRIGGAMMTQRECGICKEPQQYSSTATEPLCTPCAKTNSLCKQCGGDINMKHARKERPF